MNTEYINVFSNTAISVLPQLGIEDVTVTGTEECSQQIDTQGVAVIIGATGDLRGSIVLATEEACAMSIASGMMGGMEVESFDELAQSAFSELGNILAANVCTELSALNVHMDISTPTLMHGEFSIKAGTNNMARLVMGINGFPFDIYISLDEKA